MNTILPFCMLAFAFMVLVGPEVKASPNVITFYKVALVCHTAPEIGCGSRAKPALLEMQNDPAIKEAWLNREGRVYAIVWQEKDQSEGIAKPIFTKHQISFNKLSEKEALTYRQTFREPDQWYQGNKVDALSQEEATKIADTYTRFLLTDQVITPAEAGSKKTDLTAYFREELIKVRSLPQLEAACRTTFMSAILNVYKTHLGQERTDRIVTQYAKKLQGEEETCINPKTDSGKSSQSCCSKKQG